MSGRGAAAVEHLDLYTSSSTASASSIFLATSSTGKNAAPFFSGRLLTPRRGADFALGLAEVVRTRYYTPPGMVQRLIQQSDPVITCGGGLLRFEGFSACCGVYARFDLLPSAVDAGRIDHGTANVDFNPPMRAALARLRDESAAQLTVSNLGFELSTESVAAFERRVSLPARWLKGFVEVQAHQARMRKCFSVGGVAAQRFFSSLPRARTRSTMHVAVAGRLLRLSTVPSPGSTPAGGLERLRTLTPVARYAEELSVYSSGDGATAWQLDTKDSRMFLVLSPEPSRGFSGEGQVLDALTANTRVTSRVRALLRWQSRIDQDEFARELNVPRSEIQAALAQLGTSGLVGFDLAEAKYFHRELPFDLSTVNKLHPRLLDAHALAESGDVETEVRGTTAWVRRKDGDYLVRRDPDGIWRCGCPWIARHGTSRGSCKHILAVRISWGETPDAG
jgi:hypothetical protein